MTRIVAFMPAKRSSDRIAGKNIAVLDGEHLFRRKLLQLLACDLIDEVYLDTEDDAIAALAADLPVKRLKRPAKLATNATDGHELFAWQCAQVEADIHVQAVCTAPFVTAATLTRALTALRDAPDRDSLVAVWKTKLYSWTGADPDYGRGRIPNSVDLPLRVVEAMSLYAVRKGAGPTKQRFGSAPILFELDPTEAIDINWPEDMALAENVASGLRAREHLQLKALAPVLSSPLLSDITREMGLKLALPPEIHATSGARMFGRARTLLLDRVREGEDWRGIYDALGSYAHVRQGDIIVVENRVRERAYFGNLNAHLALRAGAVGAVIDSVTRDSAAVDALGFPVFARGTYAVDIREEGVLRAMNAQVTIGDVAVRSGDYIFGDGDGVIAIPAGIWPTVREVVLQRVEQEAKVALATARGTDALAIWKSVGDF
jgi:regulator of RNase E activity RraA/CMP-N-acetylneuraminic acid synthetase